MLERRWICRHSEDQLYHSKTTCQKAIFRRGRGVGWEPSGYCPVDRGGVSFLVLLFWVAFSFLGGDGMLRMRFFGGGLAVLRHGREGGTVCRLIDGEGEEIFQRCN